MFDADLLSMMASTFEWHGVNSHDGFGAPITDRVVRNVVCHVTYATKIVRGNAEESANSTAQIECPPAGYRVGNVTTPTIGVDDHVILADGVDRRILSITSYTDDDGAYHQSAALT